MADFFNAVAEKIEPAALNVLRAPLFGTLVEQLRTGGRWVILDLGQARSATVKLLNHFHCRLDIVDLSTGLNALNTQKDPVLLKEQIEAMLPACRNETTDVVLCWDLLNYLQKPALTKVMECIATRARRGTLVHALIVYSSKRMPIHPGIYFPDSDDLSNDAGNFDRLVNMSVTSEECDAPQYTPDDLKRCMHGYYIERAVLLGNGMQEFLFRIS